MAQHTEYSEITFHHEPKESTWHIWRIYWILLGITVVELALGFLIAATSFPDWVVLFIKGVIVILSIAKAFYIVSYFMHLGDEIRNMIMTIVVPLFLFVWFIAAFLWDGSSYRSMRNRYDTYYKETTLDREQKSADTATHPLN
jgi:cytochrome c oxidase subunit IV